MGCGQAGAGFGKALSVFQGVCKVQVFILRMERKKGCSGAARRCTPFSVPFPPSLGEGGRGMGNGDPGCSDFKNTLVCISQGIVFPCARIYTVSNTLFHAKPGGVFTAAIH
jgi:hypothetical protein